MEVTSIESSDELDYTGIQEMFDREEMNRVGRTSTAFSRAVAQTELPAEDSLPLSKISEAPDLEVVDRVNQVAENNGIASGLSGNNFDEIIELLAEKREILANPEIPLSDEANALFPENESEADKRNFLLQFNQLVGEIMQLLSKLSDRDRKKTDGMKKEYDALNNRASGSMRDQGWAGMWISVGSLIATVAGVALGSKEIGSALGQQLPQLLSPLTSGMQADTSKYTNKISLINTELQNLSSKSGDNSGWKNELIQSLNDIKEWMRASVRTNG